ncbi:MAG: hypothetical protein NTX04_06975, partial [Verrucomicrobia bacterium]|nr:hypothetical protein [Verrucomicrobiota bacterium]
FLDCLHHDSTPLSAGISGLNLVRILEASSQSLKSLGAPVDFSHVPHPASHQRKLHHPKASLASL